MSPDFLRRLAADKKSLDKMAELIAYREKLLLAAIEASRRNETDKFNLTIDRIERNSDRIRQVVDNLSVKQEEK